MPTLTISNEGFATIVCSSVRDDSVSESKEPTISFRAMTSQVQPSVTAQKDQRQPAGRFWHRLVCCCVTEPDQTFASVISGMLRSDEDQQTFLNYAGSKILRDILVMAKQESENNLGDAAANQRPALRATLTARLNGFKKHVATWSTLASMNQPIFLFAAATGSASAVECLLDHESIDVNQRDESRQTALHGALGNVDTMRVLLNRGALVDPIDVQGRSPLWNCVSYANIEAASVLLEHAVAIGYSLRDMLEPDPVTRGARTQLPLARARELAVSMPTAQLPRRTAMVNLLESYLPQHSDDGDNSAREAEAVVTIDDEYKFAPVHTELIFTDVPQQARAGSVHGFKVDRALLALV